MRSFREEIEDHLKAQSQQRDRIQRTFRYGLALGAAVGLSAGLFVTIVALLVVA